MELPQVWDYPGWTENDDSNFSAPNTDIKIPEDFEEHEAVIKDCPGDPIFISTTVEESDHDLDKEIEGCKRLLQVTQRSYVVNFKYSPIYDNYSCRVDNAQAHEGGAAVISDVLCPESQQDSASSIMLELLLKTRNNY